MLFLGYNRPQPARAVLDAVAAARPPLLYVAIDGPNSDREGDVERVASMRRLVEETTWPCEVRTRFHDVNLGCRRAVGDALDWFFGHEPAGLVLEDDCLPSRSFFDFADEMLAEFEHDKRVWMVTGFNHVGRWHSRRGTHFFSEGGVWGWASWRDRWTSTDVTLSDIDPAAAEAVTRETGRWYWRRVRRGLELVQSHEVDTWDYQWAYARLRNGGLTVVPTRNLVTNIGSGEDSTHTSAPHPLLHTRRYELRPPYRAARTVRMDRSYLRAMRVTSILNAVRVRIRVRRQRLRERLASHAAA